MCGKMESWSIINTFLYMLFGNYNRKNIFYIYTCKTVLSVDKKGNWILPCTSENQATLSQRHACGPAERQHFTANLAHVYVRFRHVKVRFKRCHLQGV